MTLTLFELGVIVALVLLTGLYFGYRWGQADRQLKRQIAEIRLKRMRADVLQAQQRARNEGH